MKVKGRLIRDLKGSECLVLRGPAVKLVLSPTFFLSQPEGKQEAGKVKCPSQDHGDRPTASRGEAWVSCLCVSVVGQEQEADETKAEVSSLEKVVLSESQSSFSNEVRLGAWR